MEAQVSSGGTFPIVRDGEILDKYMSLPAKRPCRFGRHVWTVIETVIERSPWEIHYDLLGRMTKGNMEGFQVSGMDPFSRDVVVTKKCNRCGTEKVEVTSS